LGQRIKSIAGKVKAKLIAINLFKKKGGNEQNGRITTRLYLLTLAIAIISLLIGVVLSIETVRHTVYAPSVEQYTELYANHRQTLSCPCESLTVPYGSFVNITATFHQLCQSPFIQPSWYQNILPLNRSDQDMSFVGIASSYFYDLAKLCQIAMQQ
jgi:hypothetical protein